MLVRRRTTPSSTAHLICIADALGNSDHKRAMAPETKGAATLVPPAGKGSFPAGRLITRSPGAPSPRRPIAWPRLERGRGCPVNP